MKPTRTELLTAWMTLVKVQTTTNRGQEMIKKQLDKLMVPRFTGGAMIVVFLFGYVIGAILL